MEINLEFQGIAIGKKDGKVIVLSNSKGNSKAVK